MPGTGGDPKRPWCLSRPERAAECREGQDPTGAAESPESGAQSAHGPDSAGITFAYLRDMALGGLDPSGQMGAFGGFPLSVEDEAWAELRGVDCW